jgi:hypothetical protein
MPPLEAHDDEAVGGGSMLPEGPVGTADIELLLAESAQASVATSPERIRRWRDDLVLAQELLVHARTVLAVDVGVLRHRLADPDEELGALVDQLPRLVGARQWGESWSSPSASEIGSDLDAEVVFRATRLVAAHEAMATLDLGSTSQMRDVLAALEASLTGLSDLQLAVTARLADLRELVLRHYQRGSQSSLDWPA